MRLLSFLLAACVAVAAPRAQTASSPHSEALLVASASRVAPGDALDVALRIEIEPGWHVYWINPGDAGLPVRAEWALPEGATAGPLRFPAPQFSTLLGLASFTHTGTADFVTRIAVPADASGSFRVRARAEWLVCADVCLPAAQDVALSVPVGPATVRTAALDRSLAALPVPAEGWTASASVAGDALRLVLGPPGEASLAGARFFPEEAGVLVASAAQAFRQENGQWAADLSLADGAAPARLRGVLVADGLERAVEIDVVVEAPAAESPVGAGLGLWTALLFALGGGLLLNLMPCVFPVLGLKVLSFARAGAQSPAAMRAGGLAFGAGVLASFGALAGALLAFRSGGAALGWGFQLQSPALIAGLAVLMTGLALNLLGVFEVGTRLASLGGRFDRRGGPGGAFLSGVLAAVVATPCTAPFMGAALGYALGQPAAVALLVFAALGVGMALPVVALAFAPGLAARLPRPGAWMETLRQALAFPLFATAVWLVWVFGQQTDLDGAAALMFALVLVGLAAWTVGRWPAARASPRLRIATRGLALAALAVAVVLLARGVASDPPRPGAEPAAETLDGWTPYRPEAVDALVASGRPVFVDATAAWCLTCKVNERTSLSDPAVEAAFARKGVERVVADWTRRDADVTAFLGRFGRSGVPLYALYPGDGAAPVLLPEVLTPGVVLRALAALPDRPVAAAR